MDIRGKVALVTGGSSGLGEATARALVAAGAKVAIWDLKEELGAAVAESLGKENAFYSKINITDEASVEAGIQEILDRFGALHIVGNIAGISRPRLVIDKNGPTPLQDFKDVIDIDLVAPYNIIRLAAWSMFRQEEVNEDGERRKGRGAWLCSLCQMGHLRGCRCRTQICRYRAGLFRSEGFKACRSVYGQH